MAGKIYTRAGDRGTTQLASGEVVSKSDLRVEAYGTADELNAFLGALSDALQPLGDPRLQAPREELLEIQSLLFDLGGELAIKDTHDAMDWKSSISDALIKRLELSMDRMEETTGELSHFILPGGHPANSAAHIARTVCRRLERALVRLHTHEPVRTELTIFVNRLSDWLFMLARLIAHTTGVGDRKRCQPPFS